MAKDGGNAVEAALNQLEEQGSELVGAQAIGEFPYAICKRPVDVGEFAE
jgi:hypothetical protein